MYLIANLVKASELFCAQPCARMDIWFGIPVVDELVGEPNKAKLRIYFKKKLQVRKSYIAYTGVSLFAEIGGYLGLLLGISFMDIVRVIDILLDLVKK